MEMNKVLEKLPKHLLNLVIDQPYNEYTAEDHAVWRYVMKQNVNYLSKVAHHSYSEGLKKTGISIEEIPHMYGMNRILKEIGWAAVAVDGFIPPAAFMEFQAYNVLVIAADIRPLNQIEYTPAPDIIHEAAGHAPIIADEDYAEYLRNFGFIGSKAFSSKQDYKLYEAIRHLSILKANPYTKKEMIEEAEKKLSELEQNMGHPSEMSLIRNLHWWTVEYGLVGDLKNPKIYGAGLLSSIGESYRCMQPKVKKLPYTIDAMNYAFDITTEQPQLFVTPNFDHLTEVLDEFASKLALKKGGLYGLEQAENSNSIATIEYSSGLQVSGVLSDVIAKDGNPIFIKTTGPTSLNFKNTELEGHHKDYHNHGFSSPIGNLKNESKPIRLFTDAELIEHGIQTAKQVILEFESGVKVNGFLRSITTKSGENILMSFTDCKVTYQDEILFQPDWGIYDMAIGESIVSVFNGPADSDAYGLEYEPPVEKTHKIVHTEDAKMKHALYQQVRLIRQGGDDVKELESIWDNILKNYPEEWLLPLELLELAVDSGNTLLANELQSHLKKLIKNQSENQKTIKDGMELIKNIEHIN
jgi:phenylalanine-4-hydroxylase